MTRPDVWFVDLNGQFTEAIEGSQLREECPVEAFTADVAVALDPQIAGVHGPLAFVSPSNSFCFMDGGIDARYTTMWPGIAEEVRWRMPRLGFRTKLGRSYLPLASALAVPTEDRWGSQLIMAPTMWLPQDVSGTRNAYNACLAALHMAEKLPVRALVVPALCCGYGKMKPAKAARQCMEAVADFRNGRTRHLELAGSDFVQLQLAEPQPRVHMNMEWQDFP